MEALTTTASGRSLYSILDNLRVRHSKRVSQWVENHKDETTLFYLPPYSPEYNSDENNLKRSIGAQAMLRNIQELEANTSAFMERIPILQNKLEFETDKILAN